MAKFTTVADKLAARLLTDEEAQGLDRRDMSSLAKWAREFEAWVKANACDCDCCRQARGQAVKPARKSK